jgi:acyl-CoA synthetase (AMP-forming)/AMP-acid ligase II
MTSKTTLPTNSHLPITTLHLDGDGLPSSLHFESTLQAASDSAVTCPSLEAEDTAALIFTGGTTGLPKAAQVSHRMIAWNTLNTVIHDVTHNDVYLNVFPMFHTGGLFVYTLPQVIFGGTTILIRQFDPEQVLDSARTREGHHLCRRADHVPDADHGAKLGIGGPVIAAFLHLGRRAAACSAGGEIYKAEKNIRFKQGLA